MCLKKIIWGVIWLICLLSYKTELADHVEGTVTALVLPRLALPVVSVVSTDSAVEASSLSGAKTSMTNEERLLICICLNSRLLGREKLLRISKAEMIFDLQFQHL